MAFSIKDFFSKCDQIRRFLWIWSHLLKKSLMGNFIFSIVWCLLKVRKKMKLFAKIRDRKYKYWSIDIVANEKYITISSNCVFLSCHVRVYGESSFYNCLNVNELLAQNRPKI